MIVPSRFAAMGGRCYSAAKVIPFFSYVTSKVHRFRYIGSLCFLSLSLSCVMVFLGRVIGKDGGLSVCHEAHIYI